MRASLLVLALVFCGCHGKGYSQPSGGDDAGDDASGACTCEVGGTGTGTVACGAEQCLLGIDYLCSDGVLLPTGACGTPTPEGGLDAFVEACAPQCTPNTCSSDDGCGGVCRCPPGITCNPDQSCGNGCLRIGQQTCVLGSSAANACCADGYECKVKGGGGLGDGGADGGDAGPAGDGGGTALCCVVSGSNGQCATSTDCCDYPQAQCDPGSGTCN